MKQTLLGCIMTKLRKFFTSKVNKVRRNLKTDILENKIKDHKQKSKEKDRTERSRWHHKNMARYYENMLKKEQAKGE